jgi:pimeloyl-ACP methyl ester carboxylesterase
VVLEASRHVDADFVVTNSGPAVSPRAQERYSTKQRLRSRNWPAERVDKGVALFDELTDQLVTCDPNAGLAWLDEPTRADLVASLTAAGCFVPDTVELWTLAARIIDYEPAPALRDLRVPLLALFGSDDTVVPVAASAAALAENVAADLLHVHVIPHGDHRLQVDNDTFGPSYLATLIGFVAAQLV